MRKKNLASKAIKKVTTTKACRRLKEIIEEAEMEISKAAFSRKISRENRAINKMEKNPKYFYTYIKSLNRNK